MHETRPAKITSPIISLNGGYIRTIPVALIVAAIGIGLALFMSFGSEAGIKRFMYTYLTSFCFVLSISVGCLFFVTIMHLTRAGWSVTVRRIAELWAMCAFPLFILFLPILITVIVGSNTIYSWNVGGWSIEGNETAVAAAAAAELADRPPIEQLKGAFLNKWFFTVRVVCYFLIWGGMAWFFLKNSLNQDESGDKKLTGRMQAFSAPFMILFAVTIVFSSFDLEMSLSTFVVQHDVPGLLLCRRISGGLVHDFADRTLATANRTNHRRNHDRALPRPRQADAGFVIFWGYIASASSC